MFSYQPFQWLLGNHLIHWTLLQHFKLDNQKKALQECLNLNHAISKHNGMESTECLQNLYPEGLVML